LKRDFVRTLFAVLATLLILALGPSVSAHGSTPHSGTVVETLVGDVSLGPAGTPQAYLHAFGLSGAQGNTLHVRYNVSDPTGELVSFSLHIHVPAGGVREILNVTETSFQQDVAVVAAGFYMPQWLNLIDGNLTLHYVLYVERPPSIWVYLLDYLWFIIPGGILGLLSLKILWERRKSNRRRKDNKPDPLEPLLPKFEFK
jgi:hypothetical protein